MNAFTRFRQSTVGRITVPVVAVAAALGLRLILSRPLVPDVTLLLFVVAITVSALLCGWRSGMVATALTAVAVEIYLFEPIGTFQLDRGPDVLKVLLVILEGFLISGLAGGLRSALLRSRDTRTRYGALFSNSPVSVLLIDPETLSFMDFNGQAHRSLGYDREGFATLRLSDIAVGRSHEQIGELIRHVPAEETARFECQLAHRDGSVRTVLVTAQSIAVENRSCIHAVMLDITDRVRAEEKLARLTNTLEQRVEARTRELADAHERLEESNGRMRGIIDGTSDPIAAVDTSYRLIAFNTAYEHEFRTLFGRSIRLGDDIVEVLGRLTDDRAGVLEMWDRALRGEEFTVTERFEARDMQHVFEITYCSIHDQSGALIGASQFVRDVTERAVAEDEVQRLNQRLEALVEERTAELESLLANAPIGFAFFDPDARFLRINEPLAKINGISREEHIGRRVRDLLPEIADTVEPIVERVFATGEAVSDFEMTGQTPASPGFRRSWLTGFYPVRNRDGDVTMVGAVVTEITERKLVEEALRESEERFRVALKNSPIIVYRNDLEGRFTWVHGLRGDYTEEDLIGRRGEDFLPPDRAREINALKQQVIDDGVGLRTEFWMHLNGTRHYYDMTIEPLRDASQHIVGLTVAMMDITSLKETERALRDSERRFRGTFENAAIGIAHVDGDGRWLRVNQKLCDIVGYSRAEMTRTTFQEITHPDDLERDVEQFRRLIDGEIGSYQLEKRYFHKSGRVIWTALSVALQRDDDGGFAYAISMIEDITARKHAEKALHRADEAKNQFLAMLGHELRNPLAPISNALSILTEEGIGGEEAVGLHEIMDRQVRHLTRLVDDLLEVSRITRGKIQLRRELIDLVDVARRAAEDAAPTLRERSHRFSLSLPELPVFIDADPTRMEQVIANLLNNASKYTENGGEISMSLELDGEEAVICVRDNGIGIDRETLPHVFDLFTQSPRSLDRSQGGLGIGLALVHSLVSMHGGHVEAQSDGIGHGCTFEVRLPLASSTDGSVRIDATEPIAIAAETRARRILVVDDNVDAATTVARRLQLLGHTVWQAHDGPTALDLAREHRPEVVLLDIGLPGLDGYEVARRLRDDATFANTMLIAVTGYGQSEDRRRSSDAGFNHHLVKPVDLDVLARLVSHAAATDSKPRARTTG